ncbi:MAG: 4-hydroxythreonine-4-phosphate dehydrogenase PdxA [Bacteroidota bacterium]|nr:4-hydroxythreonine-4-phosphate dehydrogenase PdxA [Bacteroidota bacterium]
MNSRVTEAATVEKPVIGITIGDINGIGPEIIIKTLSDSRILNYCTPIIYSNAGLLNFYRKVADAKNFNPVTISTAAHIKHGQINVIQAWSEPIRINFGQELEESNLCSFKSIEFATADAKSGHLDAIVTAPIAKNSLNQEGLNFAGHTEYFAHYFGQSSSLMFMVSEDMRVGLVTGHIPIASVPEWITIERITDKLKMMNASLIQDFGIIRPKIAVLALNPHAGENGLIGNEEQTVISPAIEMLRNEEILAFGPFPADAFFARKLYNQYNGVLAMYHDQGLIPFKVLDQDRGVNYTAGLSIIRTSPDHGTGYDIAGQNIASETSFREALYLAIDIMRKRKSYLEMNENPLKRQIKREKERS